MFDRGLHYMNLDLIFARDGLLPIAAHAYTVSGILPQECDTFDSPEFSSSFGFEEKGRITVDPDTCKQVWFELREQGNVHSQKASNMLATVMADSHVFGFVAAGKDRTVVSFRGTHFLSEWLGDAELALVEYRFRSAAGLVHIGFQAIYETLRKSLITVLSQLRSNPLSLIIVGHSLGAALATLCALDPEVAKLSNGAIQAVTFASPRVGDTDFKKAFAKNVTDCLRIANRSDLVPNLPFEFPFPYRHVGQAAIINGGFTPDLGEAHGLCAGYIRGLNRVIAEPVELQALD
jgi:triacylglycerol lipase